MYCVLTTTLVIWLQKLLQLNFFIKSYVSHLKSKLKLKKNSDSDGQKEKLILINSILNILRTFFSFI